MTAVPSIDPEQFLHEQLVQACKRGIGHQRAPHVPR